MAIFRGCENSRSAVAFFLLTLVAVVLLLLPSAGQCDATENQSGSLRWAVLANLQRCNLNVDSLQVALRKHIDNTFEKGSTGATLFASEPVIKNSDGDMIAALVALGELLNNTDALPDVIFLAEGVDISAAVSDALKQNDATADILLISARSSDNYLCGASRNPRNICIVPRDAVNARALLELTSLQLQWSSMAVVFSNNGYGQSLQSVLPNQLALALTTPTVVTEVFMNPSTSDADDDALVAKLLEHKPRGLACFIVESQMLKLKAALTRANQIKNVFLIGSRETLNVFPEFGGGTEADPAWGALFVSYYTSEEKLADRGLISAGVLNKYGAYVLSHLLDAIELVGRGGGVSSVEVLRAVTFHGYTGRVSFDRSYAQRSDADFGLVTRYSGSDVVLASWYFTNYSLPPNQTTLKPDIMKALVPPSPLRAAVICLASPGSGGNVEMLYSLLFVLLQHNKAVKSTALLQGETQVNDATFSFIPVAISTGDSGVQGLSAFIPVARTCTILTGPGRSNVAMALTPVINKFAVTQIDYNSANSFFITDTYNYPHFSRTIPSDDFSYQAHSEISAYFAWERATIVSTTDLLGRSRSDAMAKALGKRNIFIEKTYLLEDYSKATVVECLKMIYKSDVSRIIHILLPLSGDDALMFFNLIDELPFMHNYVYFLSKDLCLYGDSFPKARNKLQSSICVYPYVPYERLSAINEQLTASPDIQSQMREVLAQGGFTSAADSSTVPVITAIHGFAVDAAYVVIDTVQRAVNRNVLLNRSANLQPFVRNTTLDNFTGPFSIDSHGERDFAAYNIDIQIPNAKLVLGFWNARKRPVLVIQYTKKFLWMTNSTVIPLDTFRDISFVLGNTATASTGSIVLCVFGFVGTIASFFFCFRHYRMQKLVEQALESDEVPVTEEEMRRLRGDEDNMFS